MVRPDCSVTRAAFFEPGPQKFLVKMIFIAQREIQILGKSIGLEVTLFEAGATCEDPAVRKLVMRVDTSEYPAEDNLYSQRMSSGRIDRLLRRIREFRALPKRTAGRVAARPG